MVPNLVSAVSMRAADTLQYGTPNAVCTIAAALRCFRLYQQCTEALLHTLDTPPLQW